MAQTDRTPWFWLAPIALAPALIAVLQLGRLHPDEVFQFLEPAHRLAFGGKPEAWEWHDGLRNWAIPGVLGGLLAAAAALGVDDPQLRRALLELPQYALHVAALAAAYRLIRRQLDPQLNLQREPLREPARRWLALAGTALVGWHTPVLHFAGRTLSESFSASFLLWGLERADLRDAPRRVYLQAGALLGLAVVARYGSAAIVLVALLVLLARRRVRELRAVALGGAAVALLLGALDLASWGKPFHSLIAYLRFNLSADAAASFGREPSWFYLPQLARGIAPWCWPAWLYAARERRAAPAWLPSPLLLGSALAYLLLLAATAHKEVRFLYPAIVLLDASTAPAAIMLARALARVWSRGRARLHQGLLAGAFLLALGSGLWLLRDPGRFGPRGTEQFQLFVSAARHGRGVLLLHCGSWGSPSLFYAAGRAFTLCSSPKDECTKQALRAAVYDRVVGWQTQGQKRFLRAGFRPLERRGSVVLWGR